MQFLAVFFFIFVLAGCSGGVGKLDVATMFKDGDGNPVMEQTTESVLIAEQFSEALQAVKEPIDQCNDGFSPEQVIALKEGGQEDYFTSKMICNLMISVSDAVKAARDRPTTAAGEVAYEARMSVKSVESTDAAEASSKNRVVGTSVIAGATAYGFGAFAGAMAGAGASETTVGDIQMSNSGDSMGGAGGEGPGGSVDGGERNMALAINGDTHIQSGTSNTQASGREKPVAVDNPIVSGGPENTIVNDTDGKNDASLF